VYIIIIMSDFDNGLYYKMAGVTKYRKHLHPSNSVPNYAVLYISTDNSELRQKYTSLSQAHNDKMFTSVYPDSGVDLYVPDDVTFDKHFESKFIDMQIKTKMIYHDTATMSRIGCGFYTHPRSSISKTPLMLANHTGVIDSGYRGNLIGAFRWLPSGEDTSYTVIQHTRLLQVCHPSLCPVYIQVVDEIEDTTERGSGGFGSTGK
jgi:dUTPase